MDIIKALLELRNKHLAIVENIDPLLENLTGHPMREIMVAAENPGLVPSIAPADPKRTSRLHRSRQAQGQAASWPSDLDALPPARPAAPDKPARGTSIKTRVIEAVRRMGRPVSRVDVIDWLENHYPEEKPTTDGGWASGVDSALCSMRNTGELTVTGEIKGLTRMLKLHIPGPSCPA